MTDNCELELLSAVKSDKTKRELLARIDDIAAKLTAKDPTKPPAVHYATAAERVAAEMKGEAANYKLQILTQARAMEEFNLNIAQYVQAGVNPERAYREVLAGRAEATLAEGQRAISKFVTDLERGGMDAQFYLLGKDRDFTLQLMTELQQLNKKFDAKPGITGNPKALEMARLFKGHIDPLRARLKEAGLRVADLEGRIFKQLWDRERTLLASPTAKDFVDLVLPRISRIGDQLAEDLPEAELRGLLTAHYNEILGAALPELEISPRDLVMERQTYAVRQGLSRQIHFRTVEDELFVLENFGGADVGNLMTETVRDIAEQVHRTYELGINFRATAYSGIIEAGKLGGDIARIQAGKGTLALSPQNILNKMTGFHDTNAANPSIAMWSDALHNYARAAYLSLASINVLTDIPTLNAANRRHNIEGARSVIGAVVKAVKGPNLPPEITREAGGIFEAASVHALGTMHRYITLPGVDHAIYNGSVWVADKTFKWNGLNRATRALKQVAYDGYSTKLAAQIKAQVPWEELPAIDRKTLLRAGMVDKDWNALLSAKGSVFEDGPIRFVNTANLDARLGAKVNAAMARFVSGEAVLSPDLLSQTSLDMGLQRGTWPHALIRQMTFLMGYPVAFVRQAFMAEVEHSGALSFGMARYVAMLTMMGTMTVVAGDIARGRTRDYDDPEIINQILMEGLLKGGGLTIFGEMAWKTLGIDRGVHHLMFGDNAKYSMPNQEPFNPVNDLLVGGGVEWATRLAGGVGASVLDLISGDVDKALEGLTKTAQRASPFAGLPGIKPLLDATVFDFLGEMTDSNTMEKAERRWHARTGGDFLLTDFNP